MSSISRPKINYVTGYEFYKIFNSQSQNASAKIALIIIEENLKGFDLVFKKPSKWYKIPNFSILVSQIGFGLSTNNYFFNNIDKLTQHLTSAGILRRFIDQCFPMKRQFTIEKKWKVLIMEDLNFGFVIWFVSCAACIATLVAEVFVYLTIKQIRMIFKVMKGWKKSLLISKMRKKIVLKKRLRNRKIIKVRKIVLEKM